MAGANCSIFGCPVSRRYKEISIFKVPSGTNEFKLKLRRDLINIITKDRVVDQLLRKQIESDKLYICERHFSKEQRKQEVTGSWSNSQLKSSCKSFSCPHNNIQIPAIEKREESSFILRPITTLLGNPAVIFLHQLFAKERSVYRKRRK